MTLEKVKLLVLNNMPGYTLVSETDKTLSFQKHQPEQSASCLITLILLLIFVIPGILYAIMAKKPARTVTLTITKLANGKLDITGEETEEIMHFMFPETKKYKSKSQKRNQEILIVLGILALLGICAAISMGSNGNL